MGIGEERAAFGEAIDVRRPCLWMTAQATRPIIQIIDREQQDVESFGFDVGMRRFETERERDENTEE